MSDQVTTTIDRALDFVDQSLRTGAGLATGTAATVHLTEAARLVKLARPEISEAARQAALGAEGKTDPVAITDAVIDGAAGVLDLVPVPQVQLAAGIIRALGEALRRLVFDLSKVTVTATGDLVGVADLRSTEKPKAAPKKAARKTGAKK